MKNVFLLLVPAFLITACGNQYDPVRPSDSVRYYRDNPTSSVALSVSSASSSVSELKSVVLVDQTFESAAAVTGIERLKAMKTVMIRGDVRNASLTFVLSRSGQNEGVSGVFAYSAVLDEDGIIIPETEWTRFRAVGAEWLGNCRRILSNDSELLSGKGETVERGYNLLDLPVSIGDEGCATGTKAIDLESKINDSGIALGFFPSNADYHLKVFLNYEGDLTIKQL